MNKFIVGICFYLPWIISCLNLQEIISMFISPDIAQIIAYFNLILIVGGVIILRENIKPLSSTNNLWFIFYIFYYGFGLLASAISGFQTSIIATMIPVIYFAGFNFILSDKEQFKIFFKVISICFVVTSFLTIIFLKLNIDLKTGEILRWNLDRAGGVTGDANAAALTSILAFLLFNHLFQPTNFIFRLLKIIILLMVFYSLYLTFSTTGLFTFVIVFFLVNYKFFTGLKIILIAIFIPLFYAGLFILLAQSQNLNLSPAQTYKINNLVNVLTLNFDKVDNSGRGDLLENVLYYLYKNPFLGNGVDFSVYMRGHNTYVGIWVDAGLFAFLFFVFVLIMYLLRAIALKSNVRFLTMSILIVLYIFMVSLQSVINKPYLIVLFVFAGYLIDHSIYNKGFTIKNDKTVL